MLSSFIAQSYARFHAVVAQDFRYTLSHAEARHHEERHSASFIKRRPHVRSQFRQASVITTHALRLPLDFRCAHSRRKKKERRARFPCATDFNRGLLGL